MPASYSNPTGGHFGFGDGETLIFLRGLGFGFGFGFIVGFAVDVDVDVVFEVELASGFTVLFVVELTEGFAVAFAVADALIVVFAVDCEVALAVALTDGVGDGFLVAATAELPDTASASARSRENFLNRVPI